jgi:hypothetical protein
VYCFLYCQGSDSHTDVAHVGPDTKLSAYADMHKVASRRGRTPPV